MYDKINFLNIKQNLKFKNKFSFSNTLILVSTLFTIFSFIFPEILIFGMNKYFLESGKYLGIFGQFIIYSFLHGSLLHLLSNSIFLYIFGNHLEQIIGKNKFLIFFILTTIFNGIILLIFSSGNTIGISGFAMAILVYYTLILKSQKNKEYKRGIVAIIINLLIGLDASISFIGHFAGAVFGSIFWFFEKK